MMQAISGGIRQKHYATGYAGTGNEGLDNALRQRGGLQADELELRASWLSMCFLAFSEAHLLRDEVPAAGDAGVDEARLGVFVQNVSEMARRGLTGLFGCAMDINNDDMSFTDA
eukprot:scaffold305770_cov33-Prasinocladus_malaysianus.AAC.1